MNIVDIINKKRLKQNLSKEEIQFFIEKYVNKEIEDYQMSALLMAICLNGMERNEIADLTEAMLKSGDQIDLSMINGIKVDKHSTGGVGDKTTIILLPLVASCGVKVPKMSGRGLGFTGGTIDKLESIPGFKTDIDTKQFIDQIKNINVAIASQTGNLVPADKKIYALRDVTGTVESIPLIASSIMSKKLASGADSIVIDLKVGNGALMKNLNDAKLLARTMVDIGSDHNRRVSCVITDMSQPLGNAIGNTLEIIESIDVLQNKGPKDITKLVILLATFMVSFGLDIDTEAARELVIENLKNGKAYEKFLELIKAQGGEIENLKPSNMVMSLKSNKSGFVKSIKTDELGEICRRLGGGRYEKNDEIDHSVGIVLAKKRGDYVLEDEELLKLYIGSKNIEIGQIMDCFEITDLCGEIEPLIHEVIE